MALEQHVDEWKTSQPERKEQRVRETDFSNAYESSGDTSKRHLEDIFLLLDIFSRNL